MILPLTMLAACGREEVPETLRRPDESGLTHEMIELGEKLEDPYTVENVKKAVARVYPTKAGRVDITPTDLYVRFLPRSEDDFERLQALGLNLVDHPMDYRIVREGDYYHDPSIDEEEITWQYAVVPHDFVFPEDIFHELLDECYISENDPVTRSSGEIDWEAVEREAYLLTGNGDLYAGSSGTRADEDVFPSGRITVEDPEANGGKPFGLAGVMVSCNSFVKFATAYTDRDGYYRMDKRFVSKPRYRLVFKNESGFSIGMNLVLVPASVSTLGTGSPEGIDYHVDSQSEAKLYRRSVVNNAAYDYLARCASSDLDLTAPPKDLRLWIFKGMGSSSTVMFHHGAFLQDNSLVQKYLGNYFSLLKMFLPDITVGTSDRETYADIYCAVVHEMSHASHYAKVGNRYWSHFIDYVIRSFVTEGREAYGTGTGAGAGYCEIGEMWAYFMESTLYQDRYGGGMPTFGTSFWFFPQVFRYLYERGLSRSDILRSLKEDVTSRDDLKDELIRLYPEWEATIDQVFNRYCR